MILYLPVTRETRMTAYQTAADVQLGTLDRLNPQPIVACHAKSSKAAIGKPVGRLSLKHSFNFQRWPQYLTFASK